MVLQHALVRPCIDDLQKGCPASLLEAVIQIRCHPCPRDSQSMFGRSAGNIDAISAPTRAPGTCRCDLEPEPAKNRVDEDV